MKTKIAFLGLMAALLVGAGHVTAQIDLVPGINYSYNPPGANGIIQIVNEDVCNNGNSAAGSFDVAAYIYNTNTSTAYVVGDTVLPGINGNACITINNWNININKTAGIPSGTYKLGEWVNSQHNVNETDTTNNVGLFAGSWTYSPSAVNEIGVTDIKANVSPNPGNGLFHVSINSSRPFENCSVELYNVLGKRVFKASLNPFEGGASNTSITITNCAGLYIYKISSPDGGFLASGKLMIQ